MWLLGEVGGEGGVAPYDEIAFGVGADGHHAKAVARSVTFAAITFSARIPYIGPFVSVSLGIADAFYGERFYDWVDSCW